MSEKFGLDRELAAKQEAKYDPTLEEEARKFICSKTNAVISSGKGCLVAPLKSGVVLCQLINALRPGSVSTINNGKMPFVQMENISNYLAACQKYGVRASELFQTVDLFEEKNMSAVVLNILAVARQSGYVVQATSGGPLAYQAAEHAYVPPPASAPAAKSQAFTASSDVPLLLAGAAKAGEASKGAFGTGKRDIKTYGSETTHASSSDIPLLLAGSAKAGAEASKGAHGPGMRAEIVKSNAVDYGSKGEARQNNSELPLLQKGAAEIGEAAKKGAHGPGIGNLIDKYNRQ